MLVVDDDPDAVALAQGDPGRRRSDHTDLSLGGRSAAWAEAMASRRTRLRHRDAGRGRALADPSGARDAGEPGDAGGRAQRLGIELTVVDMRKPEAARRAP